jgi:Ca2+-binding RTX toxin-like protein
MPTTPVLRIDASQLCGIDFTTYIADRFEGLGAGTNEFFGGAPDIVFGSAYYLNGSQIVTRYAEGEGEGEGQSPATALVEGETLAYDYLHYGPAYGHGISGSVDALTFGDWVEGATTGTQGLGAAGRVQGLDAGLTLEGFGLSAAPGSGFDPATNKVYALYAALRDKDAAAIYDLISDYALDVTGSAGRDSLIGYAGDDTLFGAGGRDLLRGGAGRDLVKGGAGDDRVYGGLGDDLLYGGLGDDKLVGGAGKDALTGGAGADVFVFAAGAGRDRIHDFDVARDKIDLRGFDLDGFGDIGLDEGAHGLRVTVEDLVIALQGVKAADLGADQFLI